MTAMNIISGDAGAGLRCRLAMEGWLRPFVLGQCHGEYQCGSKRSWGGCHNFCGKSIKKLCPNWTWRAIIWSRHEFD